MKLLRTVFIIMVIIPLWNGFAQSQDAQSTTLSSSSNNSNATKKQNKPLSLLERNAAKKRFLRDMSLIYDYVLENYYQEPDTDKMLFGSLSGMMGNLGDPYSSFITPEQAKRYSENIAGEFGGLGIRIDVGTDNDTDTSYIKVVAPIRGTPAERLGILSGDLILSVDNTSLANYTTLEAVKIMRGKPGTKVTLTIKRGSRIFSLEIVRAIINNINLEYDFIDDDIAYLFISSFSQDLPQDFEKAIKEINKKNYKTLIVDLRNNPGGSLSSVVKLADAFLEAGIVVGTKARDAKENKVYHSTDTLLIPKNKKVVVIVNKGSASASEIFSGAIKDRGRGTVVGSTTFGKGLVQSVNAFESGFINITISQYYTPSGTFINKKGVSPDVEIKPEYLDDNANAEKLRDLEKMVQANMALHFVEKNSNLTNEEMFHLFKKELTKQKLDIDDFLIKRSLHSARNRHKNIIEVFNLEFDSVLRSTVEMIRKGTL